MRVVGTGTGLYYGRRRAVRALSVAPFLDDDLEEEDNAVTKSRSRKRTGSFFLSRLP